MKEELVKLSGVIEYKILENGNVELKIKKQVKYGFDCRRRTGGRRYYLGSAGIFEYHTYSAEATLFLKGRDDSHVRNLTFEMAERDWPVYKDMLQEEGFELIDADNPIKEVVSENEETKVKFEYVLAEPTEDEINKMIAQVDLNTFTSIIKARLREDGACGDDLGKINRTWAKEYLIQWAKAKYRLYKLLGDKLKIEKDIEVEPDYQYFELAKRELKGKFPLLQPIFDNFSTEAIQRDEIDTDNIFNEVFTDKRVSRGMSFTKFIALYNCDELNVEVSKLYQNKGTAHLTISIDPNDYLTVSINSSGWRSCHNFINGEWRNAGLSYMVDEVSMVAYKCNGEVNYNINNQKFKWNSKNWRQMIYVSKENSATIFSRQYPNESDNIARAVREMYEDIACNYFNVENTWKVYSNVEAANIETDNEVLLYNDVNNGFGHKVVKNKFDKDIDKDIMVYLGGRPKSITCPDERLTEGEEDL